jgi:hypothetical protein
MLKVKKGDKALRKIGQMKYDNYLCTMKASHMECKFAIHVNIKYVEQKVR